MGRYLARRVRDGLVVVFIVTTVTFVLIHAAPGDPFSGQSDSSRLSPAVRAQWRHEFALDRPLPVQYARYLWNVARGDFGISFARNEPVATALARALPNTLLLMATALTLSFAAGMGIGVVQAVRHGRFTDRLLRAGSLAFYSMPDFWLALMMMLLFADRLRLLPATGAVDVATHALLSPAGRLADRLLHLVLPALTLTLLSAAGIARYQRSAMLDAATEEFVRTARAKGLTERRIWLRHILRNALVPVISVFGLAFPALLGGTVLIERVFAWPGMGRLTVEAIGARDYPVVLASVIVGSAMVVVGNLLADVLHAAADPRLRRTA